MPTPRYGVRLLSAGRPTRSSRRMRAQARHTRPAPPFADSLPEEPRPPRRGHLGRTLPSMTLPRPREWTPHSRRALLVGLSMDWCLTPYAVFGLWPQQPDPSCNGKDRDDLKPRLVSKEHRVRRGPEFTIDGDAQLLGPLHPEEVDQGCGRYRDGEDDATHHAQSKKVLTHRSSSYAKRTVVSLSCDRRRRSSAAVTSWAAF